MINLVPPRFLDDVTLLEEYEYTARLFVKLRRYLLTGDERDVPKTFREYQPFVFIRHEMLENELEQRDVEYRRLELLPEQIVTGFWKFPLSPEKVKYSINRLMRWWEHNVDAVAEVDGSFITQMQLASSEDLLDELEWQMEIYKEEYEL
jgi:hypothetical protein